MIQLVSRFLLRLPPDLAHSIGIICLKIYQWFIFLFGKKTPNRSLSIQIPPKFQFNLSTRLGLAAGFDKQAEVFPALAALGFGFVEMGTVTPLPQQGNPKPRLWRVAPEALINHMGFNSVGLRVFQANIRRWKHRIGIPVFANIGKNRETSQPNAVGDYEQCVMALEDWVEGFVINLSSPNTPGLRDLQTTEFLEKLCVVLSPEKPNLIKLSSDLPFEALNEICQFIKRTPLISGLVLVNTSRELSEKRGFPVGGLSGPPIFSKCFEKVEQAREILKNEKLIIGVGGISSLDDAKKMMGAGADLIEIYTAFVYQGPQIVKAISQVL